MTAYGPNGAVQAYGSQYGYVPGYAPGFTSGYEPATGYDAPGTGFGFGGPTVYNKPKLAGPAISFQQYPTVEQVRENVSFQIRSSWPNSSSQSRHLKFTHTIRFIEI